MRQSHCFNHMLLQKSAVLFIIIIAATVPSSVTSGGQGVPGLKDPPGIAGARAKDQATMTLHQLLDQSQSFEKPDLQIRVEAQIADLLWPTEPANAREIALRDYRLVSDANVNVKPADRFGLRAEVLRVIRKHDPTLAVKLIDQSDIGTDRDRAMLSRSPMEQITEKGALLLDGAQQNLISGDLDSARSMARASLTQGRSNVLLSFLRALQGQNPALADQFFLEVLTALRNSSPDPNAILLLGMYLFSPSTPGPFIKVNNQVFIGEGVDYATGSDLSPTLIVPYLQTAAYVLQRTLIPPGPPVRYGIAALKAYAINKLLPLFQKYLPDQAMAMELELSKLNPQAFSAASSLSKLSQASPAPSFPEGLSVVEEISKIEEIVDPTGRDEMFLKRANQARTRKDFERARALAGHVGDTKLKNQWLEFITFNEVRELIDRGRLEEAEKMATSDLEPEHRGILFSWIISAWLKRHEPQQVERLVYVGTMEATRIKIRPIRAKSFLFLANAIAPFSASRAFDLVESVEGDMNSSRDFHFDDGQLWFETDWPSGAINRTTYASGSGLVSLIPELARADFLRALHLGWSLAASDAKAFTLIGACRAIMDKNDKPIKANHLPTQRFRIGDFYPSTTQIATVS